MGKHRANTAQKIVEFGCASQAIESGFSGKKQQRTVVLLVSGSETLQTFLLIAQSGVGHCQGKSGHSALAVEPLLGAKYALLHPLVAARRESFFGCPLDFQLIMVAEESRRLSPFFEVVRIIFASQVYFSHIPVRGSEIRVGGFDLL